MAKPILNPPCVVAGVGERETASMPNHVGVDRRQAGTLADALQMAADGIGRERAAALGGEDEGAVRELPAQLAQRADLLLDLAGARSGISRRRWGGFIVVVAEGLDVFVVIVVDGLLVVSVGDRWVDDGVVGEGVTARAGCAPRARRRPRSACVRKSRQPRRRPSPTIPASVCA